MSINRRGFLHGIIAAGMAPAIVKAGVLMPVREIIVPDPLGQFGLVPWKSIHRTEVLNAHWMTEEMLRHINPMLVLTEFSRIKPMPNSTARIVKFRRYMPFAA